MVRARGQTRIQHPLTTVSGSKASKKVVVVDPHDMPGQLTTVTVRPDMTAIKKQMDAGELVPGCEYQMGNPSVTVRIK